MNDGPDLPDIRQREQPFVWPVRVYYEDTDSAGIVYYANYLRYFERARTEWLRALGFEQTDLAVQYGVVFVVRSIAVEYLRPARFNDALSISVELDDVSASQITMQQRVLRADDTLVESRVRLACVNIVAMKPVRIPKAIAAQASARIINTKTRITAT
ncbi:MAG: tol-pal system-associated acyl-CoA thioesterase [Burkholderiales bacterium]